MKKGPPIISTKVAHHYQIVVKRHKKLPKQLTTP